MDNSGQNFPNIYVRSPSEESLNDDTDGNSPSAVMSPFLSSAERHEAYDNSFKSSRRRRPSEKTMGSSSNSNENSTIKTLRNKRKSFESSKGMHSPSTEEGRSFLNDATQDCDFDALKEGLSFALGTSETDPNWFPVVSEAKTVTENDHGNSTENFSQDLSSATKEGYSDNIPLNNLNPKNARRNSGYFNYKKTNNPEQLSPFSDHAQLPADFLDPTTPISEHHSNMHDDLENLDHLETGHLSSAVNYTPSHSKRPNMLTRLSERVAGTGIATSTSPTGSSPSKSPALSNIAGGHSPISFSSRRSSYFRNNDASSSNNVSDVHSANYFNYLPDVTVTDEFNNENPLREPKASEGLGLFLKTDRESLQESSPPRSPTSSHQKSILQQFKSQNITGSSPNPKIMKNKNQFKYTDTNQMYFFGNSLKLFSSSSKIRLLCHRTISHNSANFFMLFLLVLQVALLSYRQWNPMALGGYFYAGYNWADYLLIGINIIYTYEAFAKIIAYGFIDDYAMFKELGLPYPENDIKKIYFNQNFIFKFIQKFGLSKFFEKRRSSNKIPQDLSQNGDSSDDLDVKEINLDEDGFEIPNNQNHAQKTHFDHQSYNIKQKYSSSNLNRTDSSNNSIGQDSDDSELVNEPIFQSQVLGNKNTFVLPKKREAKNIDQLQLKRAYLRNSWHRIDFLSIVFFWISLFLSIDQYDRKHHIMLFRALSCLRILRLCNLTTGTTTILTACKVAIPQLIDVAIFICCFWLFFGIIGVQSFKSSFTRQCVWFNPNDSNDTYVNSDQYCGSYIDERGVAVPYIKRDGLHSNSKKGFTCPQNSKCISGDNPYGGTVNFDNILQSMELVFVVMSANTFTDLMYDTMDSDNMGACLFFIFAIFILTVWLINVFIAVIVASFTSTRKEAAEEKKSNGNRSGIWKIFGFAQSDISSHTEQINQLKKQNVFLKYYYAFDFIFVILIFVDLFVQCFREYDMNESRRQTLYRFEAATTVFFLVEIIFRFVIHFPNWRLFFISRRNCFDLFLAIITSLIILEPIKSKLGHAYYWLTVFQLMRFYRVVLATNITRKLWLKIMGNFKAIFDLALFYFILTYLVSIIASRYFEGTISHDEIEEVDFPMHTLPNSFIALYVITTTENWTDIMYGLQQYATTTSSRAFGSIILIGWFIISNMVILNIFIAMIAKTLEVSEEGKRKQQLLQFIDNMTIRLQNLDSESGVLTRMKDKFFKKRGVKDELEKAVVNLLLSGTAVNDFLEPDASEEDEQDDSDIKNLSKSKWKRWLHVNVLRATTFFKNPFYMSKSKKHVVTNFNPANFARNIITERNILISKQNKFLKENPKFNSVFYVMGPRHRFRRLCQRLVRSSYGERIDGVEPNKIVSETFVVIMFLATISIVVTACYLTPLYRKEMVSEYGNMNWTFYLEIAFVILFTIEFFIRIIADGLIFTPNAYMRSSWNLIDLIVLISLWIEFIAFLKNDGNLTRFVRGLKALRALRLLTISETAKNNFHNTIISGFWKIINAAIISLCLLFPFAIWGLNIFNGRLGYCLDEESHEANCYNEFSSQVYNWDVMSPNVYVNPPLQFNKFTTSFSTLFQIISLEGWSDLLLSVMKSTGVGTPQQDYATPFNGFYVVLFNFVSIIFILTLFVSVIISNYSKTTGRAYMTRDQISWYQVKRYLVQVKPSKRKSVHSLSSFRRFCYSMIVEKNPYWNKFLSIILFLHVIALLMECFPSYDGLNTCRSVIYMVAASCFLINAVMLVIAQGPRTFIRYRWNVFNLVVSAGAFLTTIISFFTDPENAFLNVNKLFLVGILTFIIPRSNRLSELLRFASASLPSLISLSFTWIVVFLVYAIAMNQIFGLTKVGPNTSNNINLRSVPKALILLFRCSFGEGWNYIMDDFTLGEPYCSTVDGLDDSDCGNKQYAYMLFMSWNLISMYIFLNMFVSLIVDSFSYINHRSSYSHLIKREEIRKFKRTWQKFDPEGTGYIKPFYLPKLLHSLDGALSFHFYSGSLEIGVLCSKWFRRNNPDDPYDITINYGAIEKTLNSMDVPKIRERRKAYERFMEEAIMNMELNGDSGISFTRILLQLPLYTSFEAGECLNLIDFLERRLLVQKVQRRLHTKRVYESIAAYACRWKYVKNRNHGIRDPDIDFGTELKRRSYLANENLGVNAPSIFVTDVNNENNDATDEEDENFPLRKSSAYSNDAENEGTTSGIYVPKSPLHTYNTRNRSHSTNFHDDPKKSSKSDPPPKLYIQIPSSNNKSPTLGNISPRDDAIHMSPFMDAIDDVDLADNNLSLIDLSTLGESLENTEWGDALRKVQSENKNDKKDASKKE